MPTIKQSQNAGIGRTGTQVLTSKMSTPSPQSAGTPPSAVAAQSPFLSSPMPAIAATYDLFTRQFYAGNAIPQQRILPVK
jgi:hypothetical protein